MSRAGNSDRRRGSRRANDRAAQGDPDRSLSAPLLPGPEVHDQLLFEQNPIPMWIVDPATLSFLAVNDAAVRQYGYSPQEFRVMTLADIRPPESVSDFREKVTRRQHGLQHPGIWIHRRKDGSTLCAEITSQNLDFGGVAALLIAAYDVTALKRADERYQAIFDDAVIGIFTVTPEGRPLSVNQAMAQIHGYFTPEELLQNVTNAAELFVDPRSLFALHGAAADGIVRSAEVEVYSKDRSRRWMKVNLRTARDASGRVEAIEGTAEDITEQKQAEESLLFKNALLEAQSETTLDGILAVDENNRIVLVNRQFRSQFSIPDELVDGGDDVAMRNYAMNQMEDPEAFLEKVNYLYRHREASSRDEIKLRNGRTFDRYSAPLVDSRREHRGRIWYFRDITERKRAEEQIRFLAYYDALTELPNRTLLMDRLENALAGARRRDENVAVFFVDMDRFKVVNDSLGHAVGDALLHQAGARLRSCVRDQDTVARVGGDEFVVVLNAAGTRAEVTAAATRLVRAMSEAIVVDGHSLTTSCSVGISLFPQNSRDAATLIKYADQAVYCAKEDGRNTFQFFNEAMHTRAVERLSLESDLRGAVERGELFLVYQPQVSIRTGATTGLEALVRWRHPRFGVVSPGDFIPVAESSGLILPIGEWVLRTACLQIREWQQAGIRAVPVAVNVSALQFRHEGFCSMVRAALKDAAVPSRLIELELTESLLLSNRGVMLAVMRELKQIGVQLAIDDFGTGYSSLGYLRQFRVDKLKIDQSFIRDLGQDQADAEITAAMIALGKILNQTVLAEGVETEEQLSILRERSCDQAQGYYFSKPLSVQETTAILKKRAPLSGRLERLLLS